LTALFGPLDRLFDHLYGSRWNPLHQSGNLAVLFFGVLIATGLYLFLFYKIADPYASVARIENEIFLGTWVRSLHRLSADLAMVAVIVHILRKLLQGHTYGPRVLAWASGVVLLGTVLLCGWTGLVMVWDVQGLRVAQEGARLIDLAPILSQPLSRSFDGEQAVPSSFFFMNLFLHVALPLGVAGVLWLHVSRLARPAWLPPLPIRRWTLAALAVAAAVVPAGLAARADLLALPGEVPTDLLYAFWLPAAARLAPLAHLGLWAAGFALLFAMPKLWRPRRAIRPSRVDPDRCTGCESCFQDCPYEAISMVPRSSGLARSATVARVDPARCVGCGLCAASCAPMGVGPAGWTGREQLAEARAWLQRLAPRGREVLVLGCRNGLAGRPALLDLAGVAVQPTACAGSLHTSVVELLLRAGVGGVYLLTCPPRNCLYREGPKWLAARVDDGRDAELQPRVDRRRIALGSFSVAEAAAARADVAALLARVLALAPAAEANLDLVAACERMEREAEAAIG
jgi:ferredoxin